MNYKAIGKWMRVGQKKARLVANFIRGKKIDTALMELDLKQNRAASMIKALIKSAIANAEHNGNVNRNALVLKSVYVDGAGALKRWRPRNKGSAARELKRRSHITVELAVDVNSGDK